jgi:hypothetical protein
MEEEDWKRYLMMAASGAATGGGMGAIGKILSGSRSIPGIVASGIGGAMLGSATVPGASYLGEQVLGEPDEDDSLAYTKRSALGGAMVGGAGGALAGGYIGSGLGSALGKMAPGAASALGRNIPLDNLIVDTIKKKGGLKGALLGSILGGVGLGFMTGDEGQQVDTLMNARKQMKGKPDDILG